VCVNLFTYRCLISQAGSSPPPTLARVKRYCLPFWKDSKVEPSQRPFGPRGGKASLHTGVEFWISQYRIPHFSHQCLRKTPKCCTVVRWWLGTELRLKTWFDIFLTLDLVRIVAKALLLMRGSAGQVWHPSTPYMTGFTDIFPSRRYPVRLRLLPKVSGKRT